LCALSSFSVCCGDFCLQLLGVVAGWFNDDDLSGEDDDDDDDDDDGLPSIDVVDFLSSSRCC